MGVHLLQKIKSEQKKSYLDINQKQGRNYKKYSNLSENFRLQIIDHINIIMKYSIQSYCTSSQR